MHDIHVFWITETLGTWLRDSTKNQTKDTPLPGQCGVLQVNFQCVLPGSKFGHKISFAIRSKHSEIKSPLQAENFSGLVKRFSKFAKGIYEICDCNFFNFALIIIAGFFFQWYNSYHSYILLAIIGEEP